MAHMWVRDDSGEWASMQLVGDALALTGDRLELVQQRASDLSNDSAQLQRRKDADGEKWFLLAPAQNNWHVNGVPIRAGLRQLRDRDELRSGDCDRMFFSTESLACVEPFSGLDHPIFCPRCKQEIAGQELAVRCPNCGAWYHQTEDFSCWTYTERCSMCDQATSLDTGYRWTPDGL